MLSCFCRLRKKWGGAGFVTLVGHAENIRVACSVANLANDIYLISIAVLRLTWRLVFRSSSNRFNFFFFFFFFFFLTFI